MYHYAIPPNYMSYDYANASPPSSEETKTSESNSYCSPRYQSSVNSPPKRHPRRASSTSYTPTYTSSPHASYYSSSPYTSSPYTSSPYVHTEKSYTYNQSPHPTPNSYERPSTYQSAPFDQKHDTVKPRKTFPRDYEVDTSASYSVHNWNETKAPDKGANYYRSTLYPHPNLPKRSRGVANHTTKHKIPAGYSLRNWDPTEEPILLLGSVFDANSLGKWIYDWIVSDHGLSSPMTDVAGELWLQLLKLTGKTKAVPPMLRGLSRHGNLLRTFALGSLLQVVSALPVDPGENTGISGGPGGLDLLGWPSPCLGILFAAAATFFSKPHSRSRVPGAMALVFNYLSLVASGDATATPAVMWTLRGLATYFIVFYGDITFRKYQMGQGYFSMLVALGLLLDYCIARILLAGQGTKSSLIDELFRFSLPTFSLSLCLCTYHAYYKQNSSDALLLARAEERLRIEEQLRQSNAPSQLGNTQQSQSTQ